MANERQCCAITRQGTRCTRKTYTGEYCRQHQSETKPHAIAETAKTVAEVIAAAGGVFGLIKTMLEVWQSLPFGSGPQMPPEYEALREEIEPSPWGIHFSSIQPFNKGEDAVNWALAKAIYDQSKGSRDLATNERLVKSLETQVELLLSDMQPEVRNLLVAVIDRNASS